MNEMKGRDDSPREGDLRGPHDERVPPGSVPGHAVPEPAHRVRPDRTRATVVESQISGAFAGWGM